MSNNVTNSPKTTIAGIFVTVLAVFYYYAPQIWQHLEPASKVYFIVGVVCGVLLIIAPDRVIDAIFEGIKKKFLK